MSSLVAGDLVLADTSTIARVVVNQHRAVSAAELTSAFVTIAHAEGSLTVTPDHVMHLDGAWAPARAAKVGSLLSNGYAALGVTAARDGIVNPLTTTGTILANGLLASCYPEWIAGHMLSTSVYPLPLSMGSLLSLVFPLSVQTFYDACIEPFFGGKGGYRGLLEAVPPSFVSVAIVLLDLLIAASFALYSLSAAAWAVVGVAALMHFVARKA